jgi:hypothetical protein
MGGNFGRLGGVDLRRRQVTWIIEEGAPGNLDQDS